MRKHPNCHSNARIICLALFGALVLAGGSELLFGQAPATYEDLPYTAALLTKDPETEEFKLDDKKVRALQAIKNQVLLGQVPLQEQAANVTLYYNSYLFTSFSQLNQLSKLPERRKDIIEDLRRARSKEVRDDILGKTTRAMGEFVTSKRSGKNFHPAVRYNALLLIGELNADEAAPPAQKFPNPYAPALDMLISQYKKPNQTESLKLAAMLGMHRHAQLDWARPEASRIPADRRNEITSLMLALAAAKVPPPGTTKEGHIWMQRRALDILGALGTVGINDAVNTTLVSLVRNTDADMSLRCTAATTLSQLSEKTDKTKIKATIDPSKEVLQLGSLLVQACRDELDNIQNLHTKKYGVTGAFGEFGDPTAPGMSGMSLPGMGMSMPGMSGMSGFSGYSGMPAGAEGMSMGMAIPGAEGMYPGGSGDSKDPYVDLFRRRIKYEIQCVQAGLNGVRRLAPAAPTTGKRTVDPFEAILKATDTVKTATDPTPQLATTLPGLHKSIKESLKELEKLTAAVLPQPKPKPIDPNAPVVDPANAKGKQKAGVQPAAGKGAAAAGQAGAAGKNQGGAAAPNASQPRNAQPGVAVPKPNNGIPAPAAGAASDAPAGVPTMPPATAPGGAPAGNPNGIPPAANAKPAPPAANPNAIPPANAPAATAPASNPNAIPAGNP